MQSGKVISRNTRLLTPVGRVDSTLQLACINRGPLYGSGSPPKSSESGISSQAFFFSAARYGVTAFYLISISVHTLGIREWVGYKRTNQPRRFGVGVRFKIKRGAGFCVLIRDTPCQNISFISISGISPKTPTMLLELVAASVLSAQLSAAEYVWPSKQDFIEDMYAMQSGYIRFGFTDCQWPHFFIPPGPSY